MKILRQRRTYLDSRDVALFKPGKRALISELNFAINAKLAANNLKLG